MEVQKLNKEQSMVAEFHRKFGFTINSSPTRIDRELGRVRHYHTSNELAELGTAIEQDDLVEVADALGDLLYFIYGTGVAYGIDLGVVFAEIHRSNMSKERPDPTQYVDAKAVKGADYTPPNLEAILQSSNKSEDPNSLLKETPK